MRRSTSRSMTQAMSRIAEAARHLRRPGVVLAVASLASVATGMVPVPVLGGAASVPGLALAQTDGQAGGAAIAGDADADAASAGPDAQTTAPSAVIPRSGTVFRVPIEGVIELGLAPFVERSLREAAAAGASVVILDVDTPGGRVDAAERIADAISDSEIPVYAYVNRRAFSAGALISLAADGIYMRPGSTIGAATPVTGDGATAPEKIVSAMRSTMRSLAEARGLDPAIAEAMVDETIEVPGVSEAGRLLTLTTEEAVAVGYAEQVPDWNALMLALGTDGNPVSEQTVNWAERVVRFLSHPVVSPFLLSLGFLGLLIEVRTPGIGVGGIAGGLALAMFFGSHYIIGLAGFEGILIFGAGVVLLMIEAFLLPGMGVFGVIGLLGMLTGVYMSLLGGLPTTGDFTRAAGVLAWALTLVVVSSWILLRRLPSSRRLTTLGIFLGEESSRETGYTSAARRQELVGVEGVSVTDLRPAGTGEFGDERLDVVSDSEWIEAGTPIRIVASEGYRHVVRRVRVAGSSEGMAAHPGGSGETFP